jgi:hypothetical protein
MPFYAVVRTKDNELLKKPQFTTPEIAKKSSKGQFWEASSKPAQLYAFKTHTKLIPMEKCCRIMTQ